MFMRVIYYKMLKNASGLDENPFFPFFAGPLCQGQAGPARPLSAATGRWRGNGMYSLKSVGDIGLAPPTFFNSGFVRCGVGNGVRGPVFPLPVLLHLDLALCGRILAVLLLWPANQGCTRSQNSRSPLKISQS